MPNNDYDIDKKVEISADEMCNVVAKQWKKIRLILLLRSPLA